MNWTVDFVPMVSPLVMWGGLILGAVLVALMLFRRTRGAPLRGLALLALLGALANPTLRQEQRESLANIAIVVVDESASQLIAGRPEQAAAIKADLEQKLGQLSGLDVKWVTAARSTGEEGAGTNLFAELNRALANTPTDRLAGVVMITDGQVHDAPKAVAGLGFDAPVHTLLTGKPGEFDRRIEIVKAPRYGVVKQERDVEVVVREHGRSSGSRTPVELKVRREGKPDETVRTEIDKRVVLKMPFPHAGQNIMEIDLPVVPGELTPANNRVVIAAEGVRENLRVLLVSGEPHAGERTWRNLLKSDAAVDLVHFTILRPPEKQMNDMTPVYQLALIPFPTRELFSEKINEFDLIIFDRYQHRGILQLIYYDNIAKYVREKGGALLVAAGDDYAARTSLFSTPLRNVLPAAPTGRVIEQPFKARQTKDGARHPVTTGLTGASQTEPTWGRWLRQVEARALEGRTLLHGVDDKPLLVLERKGKGRVGLLLSDHAWLWARGFDGGGPHTDLLRRLSHWLMKEPELEEERLIATAKGYRISLERRSMNETVPPIIMSAPGGEQATIRPEKSAEGIWKASIDVKLPGLYKFQSGDLTAVAHAGLEDAREMSEVVATEAKMRPIADATGAGVYWTRGSGVLASATAVDVPRVSLIANARHLSGTGWMGLKDREAYVTRGVRLTPMFTGLMALSALLFLIALAWWREGR